MPQELIAFFQNAQPGDFILPGVAVLLWFLLMMYTLLFHFRLALYKIPLPSGSGQVPVSVIMIERNEEANLVKNLPGWLSMGYPDYEVLVVDDFSEDNSLSTLGLMKQQYRRLKFTGLSQETRFSQKLSRNLAMKAATHDRVVFVNPTMEMPVHHWLPAIGAAFDKGKQMVVGYTATKPAKGFYHTMFRIESFFQQAESMAFCLNGLPFVAGEENIAFEKKAYFDLSGFAGKMREHYLNMEIIVNAIIRRRGNSVLPAANLALRREITAGKHEFSELLYRSFTLKRSLGFGKSLALFFFDALKMLLLPVFILCLAIYPVLWMALLVLLFLLGTMMMVSIKLLQKRLGEPKIFLSSLVYGILAPWYRMVAKWGFNYKRKNR